MNAMTPAEHYAKAMENLERGDRFSSTSLYYLGMAQVHATLSLYRPPVTVELVDFVPPKRPAYNPDLDYGFNPSPTEPESAPDGYDGCHPVRAGWTGEWVIGGGKCPVSSAGHASAREAMDAHGAALLARKAEIAELNGVIVSAIPTTVTEYKHDGEDWQVTTSPAEPVQTECYTCSGYDSETCKTCLGRGTVAAIHPAHPDNHGDHSTCDPVLCLPAAERYVQRVTDEHAARDAAAPVRVSDERVAEILAVLNSSHLVAENNSFIESLHELGKAQPRSEYAEIFRFTLTDGTEFHIHGGAWEVRKR